MKTIQTTDNYFILSTGKTGTSFLLQFLQRNYPEITCLQEPRPNWLSNFFSNAYSQGIVAPFADKWIKAYLLRKRNKFVEKMHGDKYIEINSFFFGLGHVLKEALGELKILHIVRHPFTYIPSVLNYVPPVLERVLPRWRNTIKDLFIWNLNVAKAYPEKAIFWEKLSPIEKKAWYWVYVNQTIQSYRSIADKYLQIRFEDLFLREEKSENTVKTLLTFLELDLPKEFHPRQLKIKINESKIGPCLLWHQWDEKTHQSVSRICSPLMAEYGYLPYLKKSPVSYSPAQNEIGTQLV